jgi:sortase A
MAAQHPILRSTEPQPSFDLLGELIATQPGAQHPVARPARLAANTGELDLLATLLDAPAATSSVRRRPVALRSAAEQRRHALRGYRLRNWVDTALHQSERLLFVAAVLVFGYWFVDGPLRDWLHYEQQSRLTASAEAAIVPLATRPASAVVRNSPRDGHDRNMTQVVPLPYVDSERLGSTPGQSPAVDDFMAPRQRPLDVPVAVAPPQPSRLVIPALKLDTPVKEVFIVEGAWEVAEYAAGYLHGTGLPGDGNTVLAGHAGLRGAVFRDIGALAQGNDIFLDAAGWRYHYRVRDTKSVWPEQVEVLEPTTAPVLTMLTCTNWDTQRLVVVADLVDSKPSPGQ